MEKELNLCKILKGHENETFYSPTFGDVTLDDVGDTTVRFASDCYPDQSLCFWGSGEMYNTNGELSIFPSKEQRDWYKWVEEQNPKSPKIWSELAKRDNRKEYLIGKDYSKDYGKAGFIYTEEGVTPIERAALALLKIHQLIEKGYGGNVTKEEWENKSRKHIIIPAIHNDEVTFSVFTTISFANKQHIAFHTYEQREEFLSYKENVQLLKDYFMI